MSIIDQAKEEMRRANFEADDAQTVVDILTLFFGQWDSGGAVSVMAPVLQRLIAGKPLGPLTGDDDEWNEVGNGVFQNKRLSTVFKDPRFYDGKLAYDIDNPDGPRVAISFPYYPKRADVSSPVVEMEV